MNREALIEAQAWVMMIFPIAAYQLVYHYTVPTDAVDVSQWYETGFFIIIGLGLLIWTILNALVLRSGRLVKYLMIAYIFSATLNLVDEKMGLNCIPNLLEMLLNVCIWTAATIYWLHKNRYK